MSLNRPSFLRLAIAVGTASIIIGTGSWIFLSVLDFVTQLRINDTRWILTAPFVGLVTYLMFEKISPLSGRGSVLLVNLLRHKDTKPLETIPKLMAPLIVVGTWLSHLAGLSVGREGTAVQMGGSLSAYMGRLLGLGNSQYESQVVMAGVAAGFGSVFGVPIAGAAFALEVSRSGKERKVSDAIICLIASYFADSFTRFLGAGHATFPLLVRLDFNMASIFGLAVVAIVAGLLAWSFLWLLHRFKVFWAKHVTTPWLRVALGGMLFFPMAFAPNSLQRYAGLGQEVIEGAARSPANLWDPIAKIIFTVFSLGVGFRGGEVTPLFFIGATAGSALSPIFGASTTVLAGAGLVAVFGAVAGVPIACSIMAGELFGIWGFIAALPVCLTANKLCRHPRIYDI